MTKWITATQASERFGYSRMWINQLARNKRVIAKRIGSFWLIDAESVKAYKERQARD